MRLSLLGISVLAVLLIGSTTATQAAQPANQNEKKNSTQANSTQAAQPSKQTYLGVAAEGISPAVASQLPEVVPLGQGVLVASVAKGSPAATAGLKAYDILLSFDDQKLYSPEQLAKLVHGEKANREVSIRYARGGKAMTAKVTLGETERPSNVDADRVYRFLPDENMRQLFKGLESPNKDESEWQSFDSMKLSRTGDKQWKAEIEYRAKDGKKETKSFSGSREELRKDIESQKDLPTEERRQLLRALNLQDPVFEFHFPRWESIHPESQ